MLPGATIAKTPSASVADFEGSYLTADMEEQPILVLGTTGRRVAGRLRAAACCSSLLLRSRGDL
jgi:hypothetical protein